MLTVCISSWNCRCCRRCNSNSQSWISWTTLWFSRPSMCVLYLAGFPIITWLLATIGFWIISISNFKRKWQRRFPAEFGGMSRHFSSTLPSHFENKHLPPSITRTGHTWWLILQIHPLHRRMKEFLPRSSKRGMRFLPSFSKWGMRHKNTSPVLREEW